MTIAEYLQELDETISAAPEVMDVEVIRRSIWDTGMEKVAIYRYKLTMIDESLLELTERLVEEPGKFSITKYRFHWQDRDAHVIKRWDNAPHHSGVETFPNHVHDGSETHVLAHKPINAIEALKRVTSALAA